MAPTLSWSLTEPQSPQERNCIMWQKLFRKLFRSFIYSHQQLILRHGRWLCPTEQSLDSSIATPPYGGIFHFVSITIGLLWLSASKNVFLPNYVDWVPLLQQDVAWGNGKVVPRRVCDRETLFFFSPPISTQLPANDEAR